MSNKQNKKRKDEEKTQAFSFRMKIGEDEVEISGTHEEVTKTLESLPELVPNLHKAFEDLKPKTVATLTVKTEAQPAQPKAGTEENTQEFPRIAPTSNIVEAVMRTLETDWGKWRPRTEEELRQAITESGLKFSNHTLSQTLETLAKKGMVRRWNTNTGFVYILAEEKEVNLRKEHK